MRLRWLVAVLMTTVACGGQSQVRTPTVTGPSGTTTTTTTTTTISSTTASAPPGTAPLAGRILVVDPGHNGANGAHPEVINRPVDAGGFEKPCNTTGATADGLTESAFNLAVALLLQDRLAAIGATVLLTRETDDGVGPCIDERGQLAARHGADALVSIHADGGPPDGHGFHVIHPGVVEGYTDATAEPSADLAVEVRDALVNAGFTPSTYAGTDGLDQRTDLGTLNWAGVPAVIVECGNLNNADDLARLRRPNIQATIADALAAAVVGFLE